MCKKKTPHQTAAAFAKALAGNDGPPVLLSDGYSDDSDDDSDSGGSDGPPPFMDGDSDATDDDSDDGKGEVTPPSLLSDSSEDEAAGEGRDNVTIKKKL